MATLAGGGRQKTRPSPIAPVRTATALASSPSLISLQVQGRRRGAGVRRAQCRGEAAEVGARALGRRVGQGALREERRARSGEMEAQAVHSACPADGRRCVNPLRARCLALLPRRVYVLRRDAAALRSDLTSLLLSGLPADDSTLPPPPPAAAHPIDTPIGAIHRHWFSSGPVSLTFLGAVLLLCCSWSLEGVDWPPLRSPPPAHRHR